METVEDGAQRIQHSHGAFSVSTVVKIENFDTIGVLSRTQGGRTVREILEKFADLTTLRGIPHAIRTKSAASR